VRPLRRDANLTRLALARFVSRSGGFAAFFVGIWGKATYDFDATPAQLAILMGTMGVCALIGSTIAGVLVDRFDPRRVLLAGEILFFPAALAPIFANSLVSLTVAVAVMDIVGMAVFTSVAAFPPYLTSDETRLKDINAVMESAQNLAFIAGPAVGAMLVEVWGTNQIFVFDAATSLIAALLVLPVKVRRMPARARSTPLGESIQGFRTVYGSRHLRLYTAVGTLIWLSFGAFAALEPLFYRDVLNQGPAAIGWVGAIFGAGLMAGAALLGRLPVRFLGARLLVFSALGSGAGAVLYTGTDDLGFVVAGAIAWGVILGMLFPALRTLVQSHTAEGMYGRVTGTVQVHNQTAELLPLTFVPFLAAAFGVQLVLVGFGVVAILVAAALVREAASLDRYDRVPPAELSELVPEPAR
jgi:MFS transporter, DHA3 family, macrolide efflux protein